MKQNDKYIVLYRYHKDFDLVEQRLKLLRFIDPDVLVYGIFGGKHEEFGNASEHLKGYLEHNYLIKVEDGIWKWLHADITYQMWYNDFGNALSFDYAIVLEWDLLLMDSVKNLFKFPDKNTLLLSGIIPAEEVSKFWFWSRPENNAKYISFKQKVEKKFNVAVKDYAMLGPGLGMPKAFLEKLSKIDMFEAEITDELKMPVWGQILGFKLQSNNFYRKWFSFFEQHFFNANIVDVRMETVKKQMKIKTGRRAFHPFREKLDANILINMYQKAISSFGHVKNDKVMPVKTILPFLYKLHCKLIDLKFGIPKS